MAGRPELVIFDCDGVLVDSEPISNSVLAAALTAIGLPTSTDQAVREYKGRLLSDVVARAERRLGGPLPPGFVEQYELDRTAAFQRSLAPIPHAAEVVQALRSAGVSVCVASQGKPEKSELTLTLTGLRELFGSGAVFSAYSVARGKPHPDLFLHAAREMGCPPECSVVVEDTAIGVAAAVAARMRALGYAPQDNQAELEQAGAEPFTSLAQLPGLLGIG